MASVILGTYPKFRHFYTARWDDFNSKQLAHKKFLQNPFLGCLWSVWEGKIIKSAVEATIEKLF